MIGKQFIKYRLKKRRNIMATARYYIGYKTYASLDDKKLGTKNFIKGNHEVVISCTRITTAGTAKNKFLSQLSAKERKLTVVTGAIMY